MFIVSDIVVPKNKSSISKQLDYNRLELELIARMFITVDSQDVLIVNSPAKKPYFS